MQRHGADSFAQKSRECAYIPCFFLISAYLVAQFPVASADK